MLRAVAVLALVVTATSSQPPAPAPAKAGQENQNQSAPAASKAEPNQKTTSATSTAGNQSVSPSPLWIQQQLGNQAEDHPPADRWSVAATALNLIFTGLLVLLMFHQWRVMKRQSHLIGRQATLMRGQLSEMKTTSVDTHNLAMAARDTATAAKESADTAKLALYALERAEVLVTGVTILGHTVGQRINLASRVSVMLANTGRSRASDLAYECTLSASGGDNAQIISDSVTGGAKVLEPKGWINEDMAGVTAIALWAKVDGQDLVDQINGGSMDLLFSCEISYDDVFKERHNTRAVGKLHPDGALHVSNVEVT